MSTRANIILTDNTGDKLYFYRHSDGYPEGTLPTLKKFIKWIKEGKIRNNISQAAGWLIIIGAAEYRDNQIKYEERRKVDYDKRDALCDKKFGRGMMPCEPLEKWKVGAYEPTTCIHGDIEWLYTINLDTLIIKHERYYKGVTEINQFN